MAKNDQVFRLVGNNNNNKKNKYHIRVGLSRNPSTSLAVGVGVCAAVVMPAVQCAVGQAKTKRGVESFVYLRICRGKTEGPSGDKQTRQHATVHGVCIPSVITGHLARRFFFLSFCIRYAVHYQRLTHIQCNS